MILYHEAVQATCYQGHGMGALSSWTREQPQQTRVRGEDMLQSSCSVVRSNTQSQYRAGKTDLGDGLSRSWSTPSSWTV